MEEIKRVEKEDEDLEGKAEELKLDSNELILGDVKNLHVLVPGVFVHQGRFYATAVWCLVYFQSFASHELLFRGFPVLL
jgi:hypothetical protein